MTIHIAGDWHMDTRWAQAAMTALAEDGCTNLLHVGDFGYWPNAGEEFEEFLATVSDLAVQHGIRIEVTPGNHEHWGAINEQHQTNGGHPFDVAPNVWILPRAHRSMIQGRSILSVGGAASVDRQHRDDGETWFPEELISDEDALRAQAGGHADILITHDAPITGTPSVADQRRTAAAWIPVRDRIISLRQGELVEEISRSTTPLLHAHGHWHLPGAVRTRSRHVVLSLGMNRQRMNIVRVDPETLNWTPLEVYLRQSSRSRHRA